MLMRAFELCLIRSIARVQRPSVYVVQLWEFNVIRFLFYFY